MIKNKKGMIVPLILGLIVIALIAIIFISGISVRTAERAYAKANESLAEEEGFGPVIGEELLGRTLYLHRPNDWDIFAEAIKECYNKCVDSEVRAFFCNYIDTTYEVQGKKVSGISIPLLKQKLKDYPDHITFIAHGLEYKLSLEEIVVTENKLRGIESNRINGNLEMCCNVGSLPGRGIVISRIGECFNSIEEIGTVSWVYNKPKIS